MPAPIIPPTATHRLHGILLHLSASRAAAVPRGPYGLDRDDQGPGRRWGNDHGTGHGLAGDVALPQVKQDSLDPA